MPVASLAFVSRTVINIVYLVGSTTTHEEQYPARPFIIAFIQVWLHVLSWNPTRARPVLLNAETEPMLYPPRMQLVPADLTANPGKECMSRVAYPQEQTLSLALHLVPVCGHTPFSLAPVDRRSRCRYKWVEGVVMIHPVPARVRRRETLGHFDAGHMHLRHNQHWRELTSRRHKPSISTAAESLKMGTVALEGSCSGKTLG
jgi:hypothetical protein